MRNVCNALATRNLPPLKLKRNNRNKNKWQEENKLLIFLSCCVILPPGQNMIFCFRWYYKLVWCEQTTGSMTRTTHMWHGRRTKKNEFNKSTFVIWQFFLKQRLFYLMAMEKSGERAYKANGGRLTLFLSLSLSIFFPAFPFLRPSPPLVPCRMYCLPSDQPNWLVFLVVPNFVSNDLSISSHLISKIISYFPILLIFTESI